MNDTINSYPDGSVQIIFEMTYGEMTYRDALYFTNDVYQTLSNSDIENLKNDRFNAWISVIDSVNSN